MGVGRPHRCWVLGSVLQQHPSARRNEIQYVIANKRKKQFERDRQLERELTAGGERGSGEQPQAPKRHKRQRRSLSPCNSDLAKVTLTN